MAHKKETLRERRRAKRRRTRWLLTGGLLSVLLVALGGVGWLLRAESLQIKSVAVKGVDTIEEETIRSLVWSELSDSYLWVIPKTNILLYPQDSIRERLSVELSRLDAIAVNLDFPETLTVLVSEHKPFALWCRRPAPVQGASTTPARAANVPCYYLDNDGYIFDRAPHFSGDVYVRHTGNIAAGTPVGQQFLPPERFRKLTAFRQKIAEMGFEPQRVEVKKDGDRVIYTSAGTEIRFDTDKPLVRTLDDLQSVLSSQKLQLSDAVARAGIDYIDLRFEGKAYYKLTGAATSSPTD